MANVNLFLFKNVKMLKCNLKVWCQILKLWIVKKFRLNAWNSNFINLRCPTFSADNSDGLKVYFKEGHENVKIYTSSVNEIII